MTRLAGPGSNYRHVPNVERAEGARARLVDLGAAGQRRLPGLGLGLVAGAAVMLGLWYLDVGPEPEARLVGDQASTVKTRGVAQHLAQGGQQSSRQRLGG